MFPGVTFAALLFLSSSQTPRIEIPQDGSKPSSAYLGIQGTAAASVDLDVMDSDNQVRTIRSESDGHFECVLRLAPGLHQVSVRLAGQDAKISSAPVQVEISPDYPERSPAGAIELLQTADILLSSTPNSEQKELDGAHYTHVGLYLGPDMDGTPVVAEAVAMDQAADNPIGAMPLERTLTWRNPASVDIYRLVSPLPFAERKRISDWARDRVKANPGFWSVTDDFGVLVHAWLLWDSVHDRPRDETEFSRALQNLLERKTSLERLNCVTLVWQAFWRTMDYRVDLATPNRVTFGGVGARMSHKFLDRLRPYLIMPDTLALSGKLQKVGST